MTEDIVKKMQEYLATATEEQLAKDYEELVNNHNGPTVDEYFNPNSVSMEKEQIDALAAELGTTPEKAEELLEQANHFWDNKKREQQMLEEMEAIPYHLYNPIPPPINFHPRISSTKFTNPNKAKVKKKNKAQRASRRRNRK